jgi:L-rhamnose mutarotase
MQRIAFKMQLHPGYEAEYKRRHSTIWPELAVLLKQSGIADYSIFLDEETLILIGYLQIRDPLIIPQLAEHPVMKKWWEHMKDIMDVHPDNSPVAIPLTEVFYLP